MSNCSYDSYETLKVERRPDHILVIAFHRPDRLNAIDGTMHAELARIFSDVAEDEETRVVVLTGSGRAFSAGGDMDWLDSVNSAREYASVLRHGQAIIQRLLEVPQPVIAMVNGPAMGLACTLALHCDLIYAAEDAQLADPHIRVGIVAGDGGAAIWPLLIGPARAKEYLLTGDPISGADAARIGLINHALPLDQLEATVMAMARRLAQGPQLAQRFTKLAVNRLLKSVTHDVLETSLAFEGLTFLTEDRKEGIRSIVERRPPNFRGD